MAPAPTLRSFGDAISRSWTRSEMSHAGFFPLHILNMQQIRELAVQSIIQPDHEPQIFHQQPWSRSVNTNDLLRLRQEEHEAFLLFRTALSKAVQEYQTHGLAFTERDAQAVFSDILEPRLASLDAKVKSARRLFRKDTLRRALGWIASISAGLYAGFITSNILAGATTFGAAKFAAEALASTMAKSDVKEPIRMDEMYYLWQVRELASKQRHQ